MTLTDWLMENLGHALDTDHAYGPQCVDAVNSWLQSSGGTARATSPTAAGIEREVWLGHRWTANNPTNHPAAGDVVVWRQAPSIMVGAEGHTAVCVYAEQYGLVTADQNWNGARVLTLNAHSYVGVAGWQRRVW
jgi:hypothetical protein